MNRALRHPVRIFVLALSLSLGLVAVGCSSDSSTASSSTTASSVAATNGKPQSSVVLDKQAQTVLDQLLQYPIGTQAQVSSAVLTFAPGASTGLHEHEAPLYVYVLEGTITVTYEGGIVKEYSQGSAILEAMGVAHNGENKTDKPVRLLVVNIGAEGVANTVTL
jgi:quercetin dioxygenase-like cupin family protein